VTTTCSPPSTSTIRRICTSFDRLNSSPSENIRKTTPNSARSRVAAMSGISPAACGPISTPAMR
jgi:hypothetical protein